MRIGDSVKVRSRAKEIGTITAERTETDGSKAYEVETQPENSYKGRALHTWWPESYLVAAKNKGAGT